MLEKGGLDLFLQWVVKDSTGVLLSLFVEGPETGQTVDACLFFWLLLTVYLTQGHNVVAFNSSASDSTPCQPAKTVIYRTTNSEEEIPGWEICQRDSASLTTFTPRLKRAWGLHTHSGTKLFRAEPHWGAKVFSPVASASSSSTMTWTMENLYIHVSAFHLIIYAAWLCAGTRFVLVNAQHKTKAVHGVDCSHPLPTRFHRVHLLILWHAVLLTQLTVTSKAPPQCFSLKNGSRLVTYPCLDSGTM